jgi:hypothetical protein
MTCDERMAKPAHPYGRRRVNVNQSLLLNGRIKRSVAIASLGALATMGFSVGPAMAAAPNTVTAVTHTMNHPDTTNVSSACTRTSDNGPVWAYDNLSLNYGVTALGSGVYSVLITAHGSFNAIADPTTGACYTGHGSVDGWLTYMVNSTTAPDPSSVPPQEPGTLSQTDILLNQLFGGSASLTGGSSYSYTYTMVNGAKYTQIG